MCHSEYPLLAVGQNACHLAAEISSIDSHFVGEKTPSFQEILCDEFKRLPLSSTRLDGTRGSVSSRKRFIGVNQTPNRWVEGFNDKSTKQELLDSIRSSLEECSNPRRINLISNAAGTLSPTIIDDIHEEFPTLSLLSVLLIPIGGVEGIDILNFLKKP